MIDNNAQTTTSTAPKPLEHGRELLAEDLRFVAGLPRTFRSTRELSAQTKEFVGQERALAALELALGVERGGYNIFVSGLTGADKLETLRRWIAERVSAYIG